MLGGCAQSPQRSRPLIEYVIESSQYELAFDRAKRVLRDASFSLDRVDAREGIITTKPRPSVGFLTPWVGHHLTENEAWLGVMHREQRVATVRFESIDGASADLRTHTGNLKAHVDVTVERVSEPGRRRDSSGILFSNRSRFTGQASRDDAGLVRVPHRQDTALSESLLAELAGQEMRAGNGADPE